MFEVTNTPRKIHGETSTGAVIVGNAIASDNFCTIGGFGQMLARSSAITYQIETLAECLVDAKALFPDHWAEIASNKEVRRYNPDLGLRCLLEKKNRLVVATARDFGRLIGYIDWALMHDPNSSDDLAAETDIYFVEDRPDRAFVMIRMVRCSLAELRRRGVRIVRPRTKVKEHGRGRGAGLIWKRLGFQPHEIIYTSILGRTTPDG